MKREDLVKRIASGPQKVVFIKKDGTLRTMHASFWDGEIPEAKYPHLLTVYDLVNDGFRSINLDTVISVEPSDMLG